MRTQSESISWLVTAIERLQSDESVPLGTQGYNHYTTQKAHWLGWLKPAAGTGSYPRADNGKRDARDVYNHIVEPKLLLWLVKAAEVSPQLIKAANDEVATKIGLTSKSAAIRKHIPWTTLADALHRILGTTKPRTE